jgi:hypothetical protein
MPRNYRELPNEFARERNEYEMEETARAGVYTIRNISEDQLGTYRRRDLITGTQLDAGRKFQKNAKHPKVTSGYTTSIQADSADNAEALADHYLACKSLGPLTSICMEVLVFNRAAGHVHPKGLDLLRFALDHLIKHYGLRDPEPNSRIVSTSGDMDMAGKKKGYGKPTRKPIPKS